MAWIPISPSTTIVVGLIFTALALLYRAALPKPIPGIPYNRKSANSILGDIPDMLRWRRDTRETFTWMTAQCKKLNSPMVQVFVTPFSAPWVIVVDARECQDVLVRRSKEFDRSHFTTDVVGPILREHHFSFPSGPKFRAHRALLSDLMTPAFLNEVAAPQLYNATLQLLQLWSTKAALAKGHPFSAEQDIDDVALDTIWAAAVGAEVGTTRSQLELLAQIPALDLPKDLDSPVVLPEQTYPDDVTCIRTVVNSVEIGLSSPLPRLSYWFYMKIPRIRRAFRVKDKMLENALQDAEIRLAKTENTVRSAMDFILKREITLATKEERPVRVDKTVLKDELFGILLAGHETSSTTMIWGLKFLSDHQDIQHKLRQAIREAMPNAVATSKQPGFNEIVAAKMPYFDAVLEEILRCGGTAAAHARLVLADSDLLGVRLPKGSNVFFMTNGPSFTAAPMPIEERIRSRSSQESKQSIGEWDSSDVSEFKPERWLKTSADGQMRMDFQAGPNTQFGGGARGCFGKKFAYLEMRTVLTLIIWNFKLLPVPTKLADYRGYDIVAHRPQQCYVRLAEA